MKHLKLASAVVAACALTLTACGDDDGETDYPTEAIDLTIPFGAGGATDLAARAMAEALADELGQPVNPTNREGANQITAVSYVNDATADGYTLLADGGGSSTLQSLLEDLPYEWDDRTFIARVASGSHAYAVSANSGIETMDDLIEAIQEDPSSFSIAWLGGTSTSDFTTLQLLAEIDVDANDINWVPFTGSGDAMQAAAAGDVDLAVGGTSATAALYSSGDLIPLAKTGEDPNFPDVPLTADEGFPELDMIYWVGLSGPADLDDAVAEVLATTLEGLSDDEDLAASFEDLGMVVDVLTGDEFEVYIETEAETFAELDGALED
ncbi:tripartite tricarboxylate transporter substrate binding protein [Nesterenkonia ebinurensis]|uniref:tripartite tricarboxylate transporter substrate binding protein n=1 Tax=Nesterenkonia ebinurensis TaxID=2608252 RepID=UPI00123D8B6D|nr:tripartite tricarboxylate transporter substrate binding protein [Nesterenkonia ebinurensis]